MTSSGIAELSLVIIRVLLRFGGAKGAVVMVVVGVGVGLEAFLDATFAEVHLGGGGGGGCRARSPGGRSRGA